MSQWEPLPTSPGWDSTWAALSVGRVPVCWGPVVPLGIHEWQRPAQVDPHSDQSQVSPSGFALATGRW